MADHKHKLMAWMQMMESQLPNHAFIIVAVPFGETYGQAQFISNATVQGVNAAAWHLVQQTGGRRDPQAKVN